MQKLADLRKAWVSYTLPAVSVAAKDVLQDKVASLTVPNAALDLAALLMRLVAGLQQSLLASLTPREIAALAAVLAALVARYLGFFAPAPVQEASATTGTFLGMIGTF